MLRWDNAPRLDRLNQSFRLPIRPLFLLCLPLLPLALLLTGEALALEQAPAPLPTAAATPGAEVASQVWNLHAQYTTVLQYHPAFASAFEGANSLDPGNYGKETSDLTIFAGAALWRGAAVYINPEIDQGFGLDGTLGMAGFPSGEAYKVGARNPYFRLPRAFVRQVIGLSGDDATAALPDAANQLAAALPADNITITVGKYSVVDIFDTNQYAHDPKSDFLNWSIIDSGAFDYPADAWGYTYGAAVEWTQSWWTLRAAGFALSQVPNSKDIDGQFQQFGLVTEFEERHELLGRAGKIKTLLFLNRGKMGRYTDALALAQRTGSPPDTSLVRRYASRPGAALNIEQQLGQDLGGFLRVGANSGAMEAYEFTEINDSLSAGLHWGGTAWNRPQDNAGLAVAVNAISAAARGYFAAGGLGILIGDGRLPDYGRETVVETFYCMRVVDAVSLSADYQYVTNPAYNRDRGPVSIFSARLHAEF